MTLRRRLAFPAAALWLLLPIWAFPYAPLVDYPNHLSRAHWITLLERQESLRAHFQLSWVPLPNLAIDLFFLLGQPLALDPIVTGQLFLSTIALLFAAAVFRLARHPGGWLAAGLFYHSLLLYGFVNFAAGLSTFLWTFALWRHWRGHLTAPRWLALAAAAILTYLCHLAPFYFLLFSVLVEIAGEIRLFTWRGVGTHLRAALPSTTPWIPALALLLVLRLWQPPAWSNVVAWDSPGAKLRHLTMVMAGYDPLLSALALGLFAAGTLWLARDYRRISRPDALLAAAFFLGFFLSPSRAQGGFDADTRFLAAAYIWLLAALPAPTGRSPGWIVVALAILLHGLDVAAHWRIASQALREPLVLSQQIPPGQLVYPVVWLPPEGAANKQARFWSHAVHYAAARQPFVVPTAFTFSGVQPLFWRSRPTFRDLGPGQDWNEDEWSRVRMEYQYVWTWNIAGSLRQRLDRHATLIGVSGSFRLYRLVKD